MSHGHQLTKLTTEQVTLPKAHWMNKLPAVAGVIGIIGLVASFVLGAADKTQFHFSFHVAFLFFLTIALGGLFFVLVQFATKSGWSVVVRRFAENFMSTLPLFALLFVPMVIGSHTLFHWTHAEAVASDALLKGKSPFLNETFFYIRAAIYFLAWLWLARFFSRKSIEQDKTGVKDLTRAMQHRAYPGIVLFALSVTFAAFDWVMSLDPHWYSTIFGVYFFAGCVIAIYATMIIVISATRGEHFLHNVISTEHFHDLGKMLFAFVVFWTYIAFSQFFLIWYGNIPEETIFYAHRSHGTWLNVSIMMMVLHFIVPFFFLLPRTIKRMRGTLVLGALFMLGVHLMDLYWLVMPNLHKEGVVITALDVTTLLGVGGLFFAFFGVLMKRAAVVPHRDPRLAESLSFENI